VKYATAGINAKVFASKYLANLPGEATLREELLRTKKALNKRVLSAPNKEKGE
jgi:hypothetical protein